MTLIDVGHTELLQSESVLYPISESVLHSTASL